MPIIDSPEEKGVPEGFKYFGSSKWNSTCRKCKKRYPEGAPFAWDKTAPRGKRFVCMECVKKDPDMFTWAAEQRHREIQQERQSLPREVKEILQDVDTSDPKAVEEAQKAIDSYYAKEHSKKFKIIARVTNTPTGMGKGQYAAVIRFDRDVDYEEVMDALKSIVDVCEDIKIGEFDPGVGVPVFYVP